MVDLPVVGHVNHRWLILAAGGAVGLGAIVWWRRRQAVSAAPVDTSGTDPNADTSGDTGMAGGGGSLTGGADQPVGPPASNPLWTQAVLAQYTGDTQAMTAALGVYLTGGVPTADQDSLIEQAIAIEGYPPVAGPNGYPPAIRSQPAGGQTPPGGGVSGVPGAPVIHGEGVPHSAVHVAWPAVSGATGYVVWAHQLSGPNNIGNATTWSHPAVPGKDYDIQVAAANANGQGPWSNVLHVHVEH